jgi:hypothetical protein
MQRASTIGIVLLALLGLAACGGSSGKSSSKANTPATLLSQTLGSGLGEIHSGDLSLTVDADLHGLKALGSQPISLVASGPFSDRGGLDAFDLSATVTVKGTTVPVGVLATGKAIYIEFAGTYYSLPASASGARLRSALPATGASGAAGLLSRLGIQPLSWLTGAKLVGSATVGGVATEHLTAQVDIAKVLSDLATLASRIAGKKASSLLSGADLSELVSAINSSQIELYTGTQDHILRELKFAISFTVPPAAQSTLDGTTAGSFTIDAQISNLNAPEAAITAPKSPQPLSGLLSGAGKLLGL